jgi:hypothetical protein
MQPNFLSEHQLAIDTLLPSETPIQCISKNPPQITLGYESQGLKIGCNGIDDDEEEEEDLVMFVGTRNLVVGD